MISIFQIKIKDTAGFSSPAHTEMHDMACRSKSNGVIPSKSSVEKIGNYMGEWQLF